MGTDRLGAKGCDCLNECGDDTAVRTGKVEMCDWGKRLALEEGRKEAIRWRAIADELPDADETVLIYCAEASEPVWLGFLDADGWHCATTGAPTTVTHWAPMPGGPKA